MQKKILSVKALIIILAVLGMAMLVSGFVMHIIGQGRYSDDDSVQMPEEYIEEFFSNENSNPQIENYIEPEFVN